MIHIYQYVSAVHYNSCSMTYKSANPVTSKVYSAIYTGIH